MEGRNISIWDAEVNIFQDFVKMLSDQTNLLIGSKDFLGFFHPSSVN